MIGRKPPTRISSVEIKAGIFLTFCLALFIAMLFVLGKFGRTWRIKQEIRVVFTQANSMRADAPVKYNGLEVGHVKEVHLVHADAKLLAEMPVLSKRDIGNLPLNEDEREKLSQLPEDQIDASARLMITGRNMVLLVLDVLNENDAHRFHIDDEYRILGSLMGESAVEIKTGNSQVIPRNYDKVFVGLPGNMYTDLGVSISQVKDILESMAEMAGGDSGNNAIQGQLDNFQLFTERIDGVTLSMGGKLPALWDSVDARIDRSKKTFDDIDARIMAMQPKWEDALGSAQKSISGTRESAVKLIEQATENVQSYHVKAGDVAREWRQKISEYKQTLCGQISDARTWSERLLPAMDKVETLLARLDAQLNTGIETTRATLGEYVSMAMNLEEMSYRLKTSPASVAKSPEGDAAAFQNMAWRRNLARHHYLELRNELERVRLSLSAADASDKTRLARIEQLIRDTDIYLDAVPIQGSAKGGR